MTAFVKPMLAKPSTAGLNHPGYVLEPKHDGMRAVIVHDDEGVVNVYSRTGKVYTEHVPHLVYAIKRNTLPGTILDGELAVLKDAVSILDKWVPVADFNKTMRVMGSKAERARELQRQDRPVEFIAFDMLAVDGTSLVGRTQFVRTSMMEGQLWDIPEVWLNPVYLPNDENPGLFQMIYDSLLEYNIEGVILKNPHAPYTAGGRPNKVWFKVKVEKTYDVVVMGFTEANEGKTGKFKGMIGAVEFGAYDDKGELKYVGRCSGMDDATRAGWTEVWEATRDRGEFGASHLGHVIEVKCNELVGSGRFRTPRHPQYVQVRYDKAASDCLMTQFEVTA